MKNEHSNGGPSPKIAEVHSPAEDLKFIRSMIEKTQRVFPPGSAFMVVFGLIFMIGFPATQYLLTKPTLYEVIQPMWIILWVVGAATAIFNGIRSELRQQQAGLFPQLSKQIGLVWYILLLNGTAWSALRLFDIRFAELTFLWAAILGFGLSIMGILSSKEWLIGGITVLISILAASIAKEHSYVILGIVMGFACIIPAIIAQNNYRKQEKENAQA